MVGDYRFFLSVENNERRTDRYFLFRKNMVNTHSFGSVSIFKFVSPAVNDTFYGNAEIFLPRKQISIQKTGVFNEVIAFISDL